MTFLDTSVIIDFLAGDQKIAVLLKEMKRVLKPEGTMLHILPSSTWRL